MSDVDVQLDRDVACEPVLLDQDVILRGLDHVLDLLEDVALHDDEAGRVVPNMRVLGKTETYAFQARDIRALAEELVHMRVVTVARSKIVDPLVDLAEQILVPREPRLLGFLHPDNVAASPRVRENPARSRRLTGNPVVLAVDPRVQELDRCYRPQPKPKLAVWWWPANRRPARCVFGGVRRALAFVMLALVLLVPAGCGGDDSGGGGGGGGTNTTETDSDYGY